MEIVMQKLSYEKPKNAPQAKTGNVDKHGKLILEYKGRGHYNKIAFTGDEPPTKVVLTNKEKAKLQREKSKRDESQSAKLAGKNGLGRITTNYAAPLSVVNR